MAAVAAIRPAEFDELLAPERHAARPAAARADVDFGKVEELHRRRFRLGRQKAIEDKAPSLKH
jgi:hypothetical protein